jgi:hypothetical protein
MCYGVWVLVEYTAFFLLTGWRRIYYEKEEKEKMRERMRERV